MLIRPLAIDDDDEMHALFVAFRDANDANVQGMLPPEEIVMSQIREPGSGMQREAWVGIADDSHGSPIVGGSLLFLPLTDNIDKAFLGAAVHPDYQRRGYGTALAQCAIDRAIELGRKVLLGDGFASFAERDDNGPRRFAETLGFSLGSTEVMRRLELPVDDEQLLAWIAEAAPHHADYRIETYDAVPSELMPGVAHVHNQLALDAPTGEIDFEAQAETAEQLQERRDRDARAGEVTLESLALDDTGQVVAATTLHVHADRREPAHQGATLVLRDHRGHRLGLALKAVNMRELQRRFPECSAIITSNEETNANMVAINERLGFAPSGLHVAFMRVA